MANESEESWTPERKVRRLERKRKRIEVLLSSAKEAESNSEPKNVNGRLSAEEFEALKKKLHARKKILVTIPLFKLGHLGKAASLERDHGTRQPIIATDVQTLLMYAAAGDQATYQPYRWCTLNKWNHVSQVVCLVFEGLTIEDYEKNPICFKGARQILADGVEMATPASDDLTIAEDLSYISLSVNNFVKLKNDHGSLTKALEVGAIYQVLPPAKTSEDVKMEPVNADNQSEILENQTESTNTVEREKSTIDPMSGEDNLPAKSTLEPMPVEDNLPAKSTPEPMPVEDSLSARSTPEPMPVEDSLPAPLDHCKTSAEISTELLSSFPKADIPARVGKVVKDSFSRLRLLLSPELLVGEHYPLPGIYRYGKYVFTKDGYAPVTESSPMYSVDCEWVVCKGGVNGLARVAIVDEELRTVYHTLVKPQLPVVDYCTKFSGITPKLLKDVTTTWEDVQVQIRKLLPADAILIGQSLGGDLAALKMIHPYVIDTSVIFNLTGHRRRKSKLSMLSELFLGERIQFLASGHNPVEDSLAAMKLVLLKLQKGYSFGDVLLGGEVPQMRELPPVVPKKAVTKKAVPKTKIERTPGVDPDVSLNRACLYSKLLAFFQSYSKTCCLITDPGTAKVYNAKKINPDQPPAKLIESTDFKECILQTKQESLNFFLTMTHMFSCEKIDRENPEEFEERLKAVNKAIVKVHKYMAQKGMLVVVFSGSKSGEPSKNGACFVTVKRPVFD